MEHTTYLDFEEDGQPIDMYSVKLASQNLSDNFGILDITTQTPVIAWGVLVSPYQTGSYSYTFTVENGHLYFISWEIVAVSGEDPYYRTDQVGPFFSVTRDNVGAVTSFSGNFVQGAGATLMLKITDFDGNPIDSENTIISIYDSEGVGVTLANNIPEHVDTGYYVYDWNIPDDQTIGSYTIVWDYVVDDLQKAEVQYVTVSEKDIDTYWFSGRRLDFRLALEHHLSCAQSIPIYYEQAKPTMDNQVFRFTFPRWNQSTGVKIYRNKLMIDSGITIDYFKGSVKFNTALTSHDIVNADYNFRWFSDDELNRFLINALQTVNVHAPHSSYTLDTIPDRYIPAILYGAAKDALRHLMMCIQFQQPAQVFGGLENAQKAFSNFETLKQNYSKDWEKLLEQKKLGPYPKTRMVVVPEYTLPGGRSRWFRYLFKGS
jgi:hypothetical protein